MSRSPIGSVLELLVAKHKVGIALALRLLKGHNCDTAWMVWANQSVTESLYPSFGAGLLFDVSSCMCNIYSEITQESKAGHNNRILFCFDCCNPELVKVICYFIRDNHSMRMLKCLTYRNLPHIEECVRVYMSAT